MPETGADPTETEKSATVLVVEDEFMIRCLAAEVIAEMGFRVIEAALRGAVLA